MLGQSRPTKPIWKFCPPSPVSGQQDPLPAQGLWSKDRKEAAGESVLQGRGKCPFIHLFSGGR